MPGRSKTGICAAIGVYAACATGCTTGTWSVMSVPAVPERVDVPEPIWRQHQLERHSVRSLHTEIRIGISIRQMNFSLVPT